MKSLYFFLILACSLWPSLSRSEIVQGYDISKSWDGALVYVPNNFLTKTVLTVKTETPMPVVVLMHGCGGIGEHEKKWADFLKSEGFVVVLPDSFAIPNRKRNCDPSNHTTNLGITPVNELRPAEVQYAVTKLLDLPWANKERLFLMGHSEGGMAAQLAPELGFRGIVLSGFPCVVRGGIRAKLDTPVLAINWEKDPYFVNSRFKQCALTPAWQKRSNATELVLNGSGHATAFENSARDAVSKFFKALLQ